MISPREFTSVNESSLPFRASQQADQLSSLRDLISMRSLSNAKDTPRQQNLSSLPSSSELKEKVPSKIRPFIM